DSRGRVGTGVTSPRVSGELRDGPRSRVAADVRAVCRDADDRDACRSWVRFLEQSLASAMASQPRWRAGSSAERLRHVRTPVGPTTPAQPLFRLTRSSPTSCLCPGLTQSNRRGTDPYARWWGGAASRGAPPIPINRRTGAIRQVTGQGTPSA